MCTHMHKYIYSTGYQHTTVVTVSMLGDLSDNPIISTPYLYLRATLFKSLWLMLEQSALIQVFYKFDLVDIAIN